MTSTATNADRIGLNLRRGTPAESIARIQQAEQAGIRSIWMTMGALGADTLAVFAAAAMVTERVR
ncbi:MAG: LLM class flavin-dependent oxidoreductase, partial [Thermomicrobiales bacterium]|nr:LLM class flavin-dependent oxidoreductase [Thermomicrobiales bacterium]